MVSVTKKLIASINLRVDCSVESAPARDCCCAPAPENPEQAVDLCVGQRLISELHEVQLIASDREPGGHSHMSVAVPLRVMTKSLLERENVTCERVRLVTLRRSCAVSVLELSMVSAP